MLRDGQKRFKVKVLDYIITSNHIHLLVWTGSGSGSGIPLFMQFVQGEFAQQYNMQKNRKGSFWQDRYHAALIQEGHHFSRCLFYLAFNMVRAGVVEHPGEWKDCGYHELTGQRQRYKIININRLLKCLRIEDKDQFRQWYTATINDKVGNHYHVRESFWSTALAIGEKRWLGKVVDKISNRKRFNIKNDCDSVISSDDFSEFPAIYYVDS